MNRTRLVLLRTISKEFEVLHAAVESILNTELITTCRNRENVNARMIFSKILLDKGYTTTAIGEYLGKSHCTIVHYKQRFDGYILNDKRLKDSYEDAKAVYYGNFDPVYDMSNAELKQEVFSLRKKITELESKVEGLRKKHVWRGGFDRIQEVLYQKCPKGQEERVEQALNAYLNGLYY